jgi:hypothetical protein
MKRRRAGRIVIASVVGVAAWFAFAGVAQAAYGGYDGWPGKKGLYGSMCASAVSLCADPSGLLNGQYVGHDEPSLEFKSNLPGSGNDMSYTLTLPVDPPTLPTASGAGGGTWDFQLRPTFWFGLTLCDTESAPEYTKTCRPDSDRNDLVGANPRSSKYIGKHPGNAYMELQFYEPGYVEQFEGFGCTAHQWCAAMTIDSRTLDQNHGTPGTVGTENTAACNDYVLGGPEPINWAYVTTSGQTQDNAQANPLFTGTFDNPNFTDVNPDPSQDLMMNPGDRIVIHMHDTPAGFRADLTDLTTHQSGSMTASIANGFGHILYTPGSRTCQEAPYAFHPEYSTAQPQGNTWSAHSYNVAFSDEIGHFENCLAIDANFNCTTPGSQDAGGLDEDDGNNFCVPGTDSTLVQIDGCFSSDADWDGQSYRKDWPGTIQNPRADRRVHPTSVLFTSPTTNGRNYSTIAFETDLPRIEASDSQDNPPFCDRMTGANCVNPPNGAQFYPFFTTGLHGGTCTWQMGGNFIPGTIDHFGGSSTTEFGPVLRTLYPFPVFTPGTRVNNFNSGDQPNVCPAGQINEFVRRR